MATTTSGSGAAGLSYAGQANNATTSALVNLATGPASLYDYANSSARAKAASDAAAVQRGATALAALDAGELANKVNLYATMNESRNANEYIRGAADGEYRRMSQANRAMRREQYKLRSNLLKYDYLAGYYRMASGFVVVTLVVALLLLLPAALWRAGRMSMALFGAVATVLLLLYLLVAVAVGSSAGMRTQAGGWDQHNFREPESLRKAGSNDTGMPSGSCGSDGTSGGSNSGSDDPYSGSEGSDALSCDEGGAQYTLRYNIADAALPVKDRDGNAIAPSLQRYWDYYVHGQAQGLEWPGVGCADTVSCEDATRMYRERYLPAGATDFGPNTTAWRHYNANMATNVWPGPPYGCT